MTKWQNVLVVGSWDSLLGVCIKQYTPRCGLVGAISSTRQHGVVGVVMVGDVTIHVSSAGACC